MTQSYGDLWVLGEEVDTIRAFAPWTGCRDLTEAEMEDFVMMAEYLIYNSNSACFETGLKIYGMLYTNKVKIGTSTAGFDGYPYQTVNPQYEYIVMQPDFLNGSWEKRARLTHEGFHALGNVSYNSNETLRDAANASIYDPAANNHANACT